MDWIIKNGLTLYLTGLFEGPKGAPVLHHDDQRQLLLLSPDPSLVAVEDDVVS